MVLLMVATVAALLVGTDGNYPVFSASHDMRRLLLPADTRIGTIVYRLRATDPDRDYPLTFAATDYGSYVIRIESLPCPANSSSCLANVYLERSVAPGQLYKFRMTVRDSTGDTTTIGVTIEVTGGSGDINTIFPHIPGVIMVPEDTKVGTELEYVIVRKNPRYTRSASLELWKEVNGSYIHSAPEFRLVQSSKKDTSTGLIKLAEELDYEQQTMYRLAIYALDMYVVAGEDSRNIAGFQLVVVVSDVQDTAPIFDHIDPITVLPINLTQGDLVLKVTARDGDTGSPRQIKYGLVSEGNPFTVFFAIDRDNGEIRLVRPLRELASISRPHQPVLLSVLAEEVVLSQDEPPALATEAKVALLLGELGNTAPYFQSTHYVTTLKENSPQGTKLVFDDSYITQVRDDDMGKHGVFSLSLENNNGTFEVNPSIAERRSDFEIRVRDNSMLDYESNRVLTFKVHLIRTHPRSQVKCHLIRISQYNGALRGTLGLRLWVVAQEVAPDQKALFSTVNVTVYLSDVNDNSPVFSADQYTVTMPENVTVGYQVTTVTATDPDTGLSGLVRYTAILGFLNTSLSLHPHTGVITVNTPRHGFDREQASEYRFIVEARDNDGTGSITTVPLTINVLDVNDEAPKFLRDPMDFILDKDGLGFTERAFIKATDADAEPPNNIVRYEIVSGNYGDRFSVQGETGELLVVRSVNRQVRQVTLSMTLLTVRAYDMGVPTQWSIAHVRVYPYSSGARVLTFIVPGAPDRTAVQRLLEGVTGGKVTVQEVTTYKNNFQGPATDLTQGSSEVEKSVVVATVLYTGHSIVDVEKMNQLNNRTELVASVGEYQTENRVLFWILLIILLLIALALITLLSCCLCPCCPLFATTRKRSRVHSTENVHFVVKEDNPGHESKAVQAEVDRKEAWSADTYTRRSWQFNRRNTQPQRVVLVEGPRHAGQNTHPHPHTHTHAQAQPVSVIYTRDLAQRQDHVILEDVDGTEYRVLDPSRLSRAVRVEEDADAESIRRHEFDRGSDIGRGQRQEMLAATEPRPRDPMFIRDGNAEILRLVTRGREELDEPRLNQPDTRPFTVVEGVESAAKHEEEGKEIIMQRFIEDQKKSTEASENQKEQETKQTEGLDSVEHDNKNNSKSDNLLQRLMDQPQRNLSTGDVNRLTTLQRDLLLTRFLVEEQRRTFANVTVHDDTQSLPGVVASMATMSTQTDVNRGTQTEILYTMRPPRRKAKSDLDDSGESDTETSYNLHGKLIKKYNKNKRRLNRDLDVPERGRSVSRCEIKTPILEETESAMENMADYSQPHYSKGIESQSGFAATKSSMLRLQTTRKKLQECGSTEEQTVPISKNVHSSTSESSNGFKASKRKSVSEQNLPLATSYAIEAVQDLDRRTGSKSLQATPVAGRKHFENEQQIAEKRTRHEVSFGNNNDNSGEDLEEDIFDRSKSSLSTRNASTSPIQTYTKRTSTSAERLSPKKNEKERKSPEKNMTKNVTTTTNLEARKTSGQSRYMEWYKTKKAERDKKKAEEKEEERKRMMKPGKLLSKRMLRRETPTPKDNQPEEATSKTPDLKSVHTHIVKKQNAIKQNVIDALQDGKKGRSGGNQTSRSPERRLNINDLSEEVKQRMFEDDRDSGIAMVAPGSQKMKRKNQNLMEKKSVFTIAYDDMHTKQLRLDSASPP